MSLHTHLTLQPQYDKAKSFYNKAKVEISSKNGITTYDLISYTTKVAQIKEQPYTVQRVATVYGTHSNTTLRHIKEFLRQLGFKAVSKAQIIKDYIIE